MVLGNQEQEVEEGLQDKAEAEVPRPSQRSGVLV